MATQGPQFPSAAASSVQGSESSDAWVNPTNVFSDNGAEAQITAASYDSPDISQRLYASGFGFSIPGTATINGVVVEIERRVFAGTAADSRVQLATAAATLLGSNKSTGAAWNAGTVASYGGAADTWGAALTPTIVNNSNFGVALAVQATSANADIGVDFIRMTVHYTEPDSNFAVPPQTVAVSVPVIKLRTETNYTDEVIASSPVGYWRLEDETGASVLSAMVGTDLPVVTGTVTQAVGPILTEAASRGLSADGSAGASVAGLLPSATQATIMSWVKYPVGTAGTHEFVFGARNDSNADMYFALLTSGPLECRIRTSTGVTDANFTPTLDGAWHLLTMVWDGSNLRVYEDDTLVSGPSARDGAFPAGGITFSVWKDPTGNSSPSVYEQSNVAVFPTALSETAIDNIYTAAIGGGAGANHNVTAQAMSLVLVPPSVVTEVNFQVPVATVPLAVVPPSIVGGAAYDVPVQVVGASVTPVTVITDQNLQITPLSVALGLLSPPVASGANVDVVAQTIQLQNTPVVVTTAGDVAVELLPLALALGVSATAITGAEYTVPIQSVSIVGVAPVVQHGVNHPVTAQSINLGTFAPAVLGGANVSVAAQSILLVQTVVLTDVSSTQVPVGPLQVILMTNGGKDMGMYLERRGPGVSITRERYRQPLG